MACVHTWQANVIPAVMESTGRALLRLLVTLPAHRVAVMTAVAPELKKTVGGSTDCVVRIVEEEGFLAFWRPFWLRLVHVPTVPMIQFSQAVVHSLLPVTQLPYFTNMLVAGSLGEGAMLAVTHPLHVITVRATVQGELGGKLPLMPPGGLYTGLSLSFVTIVIRRTMMYSLFGLVRRQQWLPAPVARAGLLVLVATVTHPLLVVQDRMACAQGGRAEMGPLRMTRTILDTEGPFALIAGLRASIAGVLLSSLVRELF
mmetsp:Transcript_9295/g.26065  ORF Transcript_9295/g.26065 Transcript_9295/m.26065 type:complete len:258 (-) Transcript_9295:349-1122(-)